MRDRMKNELTKIEEKVNFLQAEKFQPANRGADKQNELEVKLNMTNKELTLKQNGFNFTNK